MLEDLGWRTFGQCRISSRRTALFKITWGSSLLTLTGYCALSCAGHVVRFWKVSSLVKLACPLGMFPFFFQEELFSGTICLLLSLANTAV